MQAKLRDRIAHGEQKIQQIEVREESKWLPLLSRSSSPVQVGKNIGACLKAGGATVNDITFTISSVTAPADFYKYADLLPRYFGPPTPESKTVRAPQLSSPDVLLQVEAFAAIK